MYAEGKKCKSCLNASPLSCKELFRCCQPCPHRSAHRAWAQGWWLCGICAGGSGQHLPPSSLPYPLPAFPCPSLPMPSKHTRNSPVSPSMLLARTFPAKFPCSGVAVQCVDVFPMTVYKPFGAGVCPGVCGVSGSSGAGIRSTTEVLSVTQHQLDTFSSHACDVRLHWRTWIKQHGNESCNRNCTLCLASKPSTELTREPSVQTTPPHHSCFSNGGHESVMAPASSPLWEMHPYLHSGDNFSCREKCQRSGSVLLPISCNGRVWWHVSHCPTSSWTGVLGAVPLHSPGHKEGSLQGSVSCWEHGPRAGCVCLKCCSLCQCQVGLVAACRMLLAAAHPFHRLLSLSFPPAIQDIGNGVSWVMVTTLPLTTCDSRLLQRLQLLGQGGTAWLWAHPGFPQGEQPDLPQQPHTFCLAFSFQNNHIWEETGASAPDRCTGLDHLIWESSFSHWLTVLLKKASSLPGAVLRYPMKSAGKTVT